MLYILKLLIATGILVLGYFLGYFLRHWTMDEQKELKKYFNILTLVSLIAGVYGLFIGSDWLMFTFFFIAIVTSRSFVEGKTKNKEK